MVKSVFVDVVGNKEINQKQQNVIKKIIQHFTAFPWNGN